MSDIDEYHNLIMKILHIGKYFPPFFGGIENFMFEFLTQQAESTHNVTAFVHHHEPGKKVLIEKQSKIKIIRVPVNGVAAYAPISPLFGYYLNQELQKNLPDVINIHMPNLSAFWCLLLPSARKIPWVIHWHADVLGAAPDIKLKLLYPFYRFFEQLILKQASKIIVTSPPYAHTSKPLLSYSNKLEVIPLGLPALSSVNTDTFTEAQPLNCLMIGRLTYYKGHQLIIDALSKLKQKNVCINLKIVGNGELKTKLTQQIIRLGLTKQVQMLGSLSTKVLQAELNATDLLCLPSIERTEAFGVVLLEAMRAGKPCLVTDVPGSGMSWVVQDGVTGFVVKHNDVISLAAKLSEISHNKFILAKLGANGKQRFEEHFTIKAVSHKVIKLYNKLIMSKKIDTID